MRTTVQTTQTKKSRGNAFCGKVAEADAFGQGLELLMPGSKPQIKSVPGAICSIILYVTLLMYTGYRMAQLIKRNNYNVLTEVQNDFFSEDFAVTSANGFNIAAAVTGYGDYKDIEDEEIGTVEFYLKSWEDDGSPLKFRKLKTRPCQFADFEGEEGANEEALFYPIHFKSTSYKQYIPKMKCIDEDFEVYGDFNTNIASNLMVTFETCDPEKRTCADPADIEKWLKFKYIVIAENTENYLQTKPSGERKEAFSRMSWNAISAGSRTDKVKYVTFNDIQLEDVPIGISIGRSGLKNERVLTLVDGPSRLLPYTNQILNSVTYEINHQRIMIERVDYGVFEFLGDIGGLYGLFFDFFGPFVLMFLVADGTSAAIASQLTDMTETTSAETSETDGSSIVNNSWLMLKLKTSNCLTRILCFCCCRPTRLEERIKIGQELVERELDVSFLLKRLHVLEGIAKETLTPSQWSAKWHTYEKLKLEEQSVPDLGTSTRYLMEETQDRGDLKPNQMRPSSVPTQVMRPSSVPTRHEDRNTQRSQLRDKDEEHQRDVVQLADYKVADVQYYNQKIKQTIQIASNLDKINQHTDEDDKQIEK